MRFDISEDQQLLRDATRDFIAGECPMEAARRLAEESDEGYSTDHWAKLAELGYLGLVAGEQAGGQGMGAVELAVVAEEMGRACFPGPYLDVVVAARVLELAERDSVAADIATGKLTVVLATRDTVWPGESGGATFADGRVTGSKVFVPFAASADKLLVTTDKGVALVDGPFQLDAMTTMDEATRFARVNFDNAAELLGDNALVEKANELATIGSAAMALGVCQVTLEMTVEYTREREAFGRPIATFQALQHRMADMLLRAEGSRSLVYRAAWALDAAQPEAALMLGSAKAWAAESALANSRECLQMHGGNGFTWEYSVHRYLKLAGTLDQFNGARDEMLERALLAAEELASESVAGKIAAG